VKQQNLRNKTREYLNDKIKELETQSKNKNIRDAEIKLGTLSTYIQHDKG
jgi:hypothetical protein